MKPTVDTPSPGELALAGLRGDHRLLHDAIDWSMRALRVREDHRDDLGQEVSLKLYRSGRFEGDNPGAALNYLRQVIRTTYIDQLRREPAAAKGDSPQETSIGAEESGPLAHIEAVETLRTLHRLRMQLLLLAAQDTSPSHPGPYRSVRYFLDERLHLLDAPDSPTPVSAEEAATLRYRGRLAALKLVARTSSHFSNDQDALNMLLQKEPQRGQPSQPEDVSQEETT